MQQREASNRRIIVGVVGVVLVALLLWVGYQSYKKPESLAERGRVMGASSSQWAPANVRPATLFECYEHSRENVPPRNDTGTRQRNWQAPPMPLETIRAAVNEKSVPQDRELLAWFERWDANYRAGRPAYAGDEQLRASLEGTQLSFEVLFKLGAAMGFLEHENIAAAFYRAALRQAEAEFKNKRYDRSSMTFSATEMQDWGEVN